MTPLEINKAIAEACGWSFVGLMKRGLWYRPNAKGYTAHESEAWRLTLKEAKKHEYLKGSPDERVSVVWLSAPNYHGDLNAMHEAEGTLSHDEQLEYAELLTSNLSEEFCDLEGTREHVFASARFTAAQRAEAFLRVKGLWRETI